MPARETTTVCGFVLRERLGSGGMGNVFLAVELATGQEVAIKFLPLRSPTLSFLSESRLCGRLCHPHVVALLGQGHTDQGEYLVMEYVAGENLRVRMNRGLLGTYETLHAVLLPVTEALEYMHGCGLLHLDLKPENILCGWDGSLKVTDYGLARAPTVNPEHTPLERVSYSLDYSAPEVRFGLRIDARADLFSLGTLAYELLSGRLPGRVYRPLSLGDYLFSSSLNELFRRTLSRDPDDRPGSVAEFRRDLLAACPPTARVELTTPDVVVSLSPP